MATLNWLPNDPLKISFTSKLLAATSCFITIYSIAWLSQQLSLGMGSPILVASMGPSAIMLYFAPNNPMSKPWPFLGGQLTCSVIGVTCALLFHDIAFASAYAIGASVIAMLLLRCMHPPGAASALMPILSGEPVSSLGYGFVIMPVAVNVVTMLVMALIINRWVLRRQHAPVSG